MRIPTALILAFLALSPNAFANGYKILCVKSAKATAMGEAFIVQADDPSAIAFNPAGLWQVSGNQISLQSTLCNAYTEYTSPTGETTDNESKWQPVPALFFSSDLGTTNMAAGLGITVPNGLSSEWADDSFARYAATYNKLTVADISPVYSIRLTDHVSLGGGLDYYYSEAEMCRMVDVGALLGQPGSMDVESKLKGDGNTWAGNAGAIYKINEQHALAFTYRLPYSIDYEGEMTLGEQHYDINTSIDYPAVAVAGYAFRPTPRLKLEVNADWTHWNRVDDIVVHYDQAGMPDTTMEQDFHNTMAYKAGAEYHLTDQWDLRAGYIYNENATAQHTWSPSFPDSDMQFFTAGAGFHHHRFTVDAALQLVYYRERDISKALDPNDPYAAKINGSYETWAPCFSLAATYQF